MSNKCYVCGGSKLPLTIAQTEEGKRIHVHTEMCMSVFNSKERAKKKRDVDLKVAGINMWSVKWEETAYGWVHKQPCYCPKHKEINTPTKVKYIEK